MKRNPTLVVLSSVILSGSIAAAQLPGPQPPPPPAQQQPAQRPVHQPRILALPGPVPRAGEPLPGLTPEQMADFAEGLEDFEQVEQVEGGLGPVFNDVSCVACHFAGGPGGAGAVTVTRYGRRTPTGFDPLTLLGGTLLHQNSIDLGIREVIPKPANVIAHRQSTPLFGLGLIEAIPDRAILANAQHPSIDGIRGRAVQVTDLATGQSRVGRFGWKAQQASLLGFAADAYLNEMGITSRLLPNDIAPNGDTELLAAYDKVADPEDAVDPATGKGDIDKVADFMRLLAPAAPLSLSFNAQNGRQLFQQANCAVCHVPVMMTGPSPVAALNQKPVALFSDLLVHDMGLLGDGIAQGAAGPQEMRTAPLWGLRLSAPYLHDGRAATIDDAIRAHDGEAKNSRDRYLRLTPLQRQQLLEFLGSI